MKDLEGRNALVTGASSGIGKASAKKLAENGVNVAVASRSRDELKELSERLEDEHGVTTAVIPTDVKEEDEVSEMMDRAVEELGALDIVLNNAGLARTGDIEEMPTEHYRDTMGVNCDGMFFTAREAIPHLKETGGNLIFIGSIAGQYPRGGNPLYAATKWWTRGFALSLSAQIGDEDVAVSVINPSEVRTDFNSEEGEAFEETFEKGEVTEPEDIAEAVVYAARQEDRNTAAEIDLYRKDKLGDMHLG